MIGDTQVTYRIDRTRGPSKAQLGFRDVKVIKPQTEERAREVLAAMGTLYPDDSFRLVRITSEVIG